MNIIKEVLEVYANRSDWFFELLVEHIGLSLVTIILAAGIGLLLGIFISQKEKAAPIVLTIANVFYTIPSISLLGMLIPFIGIGNKTAIVALTIYGIMPMVRNTYAGLRGVSQDVILAARGMGSTELQIMMKIKLPLAMGVIIAGVRNMAVMTISVTAVASFIGAGGLGVAIYRGITVYNTALTFAGSFLIALLALICDLALGYLEKRLKKRSTF